MPLTPEEIQRLLSKPTRTRGAKGSSGIDTSKRDHETWFKLAHKMFDTEINDFAECSNKACEDPREPGNAKMIAVVAGVNMCRYCFLTNYMIEDPNQLGIINTQQM